MRKLVYIITLLLLVSCKSVQYVPVETVHTEYKDHYIRDSIFVEKVLHDSVSWKQQGDTVYINHWHTEYKDRWRDKLVTDTVILRDSVQVPFPVPAQLTQWQKFYCDYGKIMLGATIAAIIALLIIATEWLRKRIP